LLLKKRAPAQLSQSQSALFDICHADRISGSVN
jgi:hypothetical protein